MLQLTSEMGSVRRSGLWLVAAALTGACGGTSPLTTSSGGALTLTVTTVAPSLDDLTVTSGEIELERLGLVSDASSVGDNPESIPRITFTIGAPPQLETYPMPEPGLYSRLAATVDHIALVGTWRGVPLQINTKGNEQTADIAAAAQEVSATSSAQFGLLIDGTQWLDATLLDDAQMTDDEIVIDLEHASDEVDQIVTRVVQSFSLGS